MTTALHLAKLEDLERLSGLVTAFHAEQQIVQDAATQAAALRPLLEGSPYGVAYLLGPRRAPIGYVIVTFGWSVEFGGMDAFIDEIYIRPGVRGRGMGSEVLHSLPKALENAGICAFHIEVDRTNDALQQLYTRAGFELRDRAVLMSRRIT